MCGFFGNPIWLAERAFIHHLNVSSAFLSGKMSEKDAVYVRPPQDLYLGLLNSTWNDKFGQPVVLEYSDAYWAGDVTDRRSTSRSVTAINEILAVWMSPKQVGVALSSFESEYIAISECKK